MKPNKWAGAAGRANLMFVLYSLTLAGVLCTADGRALDAAVLDQRLPAQSIS